MRLKDLLKDIKNITLKGSSNPVITGLSAHSKSLKPGELYIAFKGQSFDGRDFINEAVNSKAAGVITDIYNPLLDKKFVQIITKDPKALGSSLALKFYSPLDYLLGVTGTNGKTTVSFCVQSLFNALDIKCGLVGTCHLDNLNSIKQATLTTPDSITLARIISEVKQNKGEALITEVSSHALDQKRVFGHKFQTVIFTNLTHDHLDYHKTMEAYAESKLKLFLDDYMPKNKGYAVINIDDPFSKVILEKTKREVFTYSLHDERADFYLKDTLTHTRGIEGTLVFKSKHYKLESSLVGLFNASNLLAAIATAYSVCFNIDKIMQHTKAINGAPGRLEKVKDNIFIDYAHTPDGLESVLTSLKKLPFKKIRLLFGCGGDRDKQKRPLMGKIAESFADEIIVTSDNPRTENPESIIQDILEGMSKQKHSVFVDRKEAIKNALQDLSDDTLLLIAGKGHEKIQIIGTTSVPFDEKDIINELLLERV